MLLVCQNRKYVTISASEFFFGFKRRDSVTVTHVLFELGLQSFYTLIFNSRVIFGRSWILCTCW